MFRRTFVIVGNKAATAPFGLNDLAGAAGRMDLMCRAVSAAFFLSHDLRRDVRAYLVLLGPPSPPRAIRFSGNEVKYMSPDERNIAGLIRKALGQEDMGRHWTASTPGVEVSARDLSAVLDEVGGDAPGGRFYLHEGGSPLEDATIPSTGTVFLLGDHMGLEEGQEGLVGDWTRLSLGERSYHTDHCIAVVNHHLDRRVP